MSNGSKPPKERINISYKTKTNGQEQDIELPLKMMVLANLKGDSLDYSLEERETIQINKNNFDQVIDQMGVSLDIEVENTLGGENDTLGIQLDFRGINDFSPDSIVQQVPELQKLMKMREALVALKGPIGNIPDFRKALLNVVKDEQTRERALLELKDTQDEQE